MKNFRSPLARLRERFKSTRTPSLDIDDPELRTVVEAFDETEAASGALGRSTTWNSDRPAVLRHHLAVPARHVTAVRSLVEQDGWALREQDARGCPTEDSAHHDQDRTVTVIALRVQLLDSLHCAQESSRMAGLAQRFRGRALGWDALQPEQAG
ncbi:hypothetical protein FHX42_002976 [Saccharopolyspora lacisalsi]|uniref:Uncharacterized protein n=1 Tax=Halosaccharopolyspora lacisalsi TaxID=1000566 RepID=A0A839DXL0_9PSEU|nr:hypothetical protein [Halosaccharopolyspora lacisalsi]MBA8825610.1 hypothetical protein [Halosaccharopolyspora lacisalsi]